MAKFLTRRGTAAQIESIINGAKEKLVLISPYTKIPEDLLQGIKHADERKVKIVVIYGKEEEPSSDRKKQLEQLRQLNNLSLYYHKNLHAKRFFNEESMVITSMNLYDYSAEHNKEMGILINRQSDVDIYFEASDEVERIIKSPETSNKSVKSKNLRPANDQHVNVKLPAVLSGHCIQCGTSIPLDIEPPYQAYCYKCYEVWEKGYDYNQKEKLCHGCGKSAKTTIKYPFCPECYKKFMLLRLKKTNFSASM